MLLVKKEEKENGEKEKSDFLAFSLQISPAGCVCRLGCTLAEKLLNVHVLEKGIRSQKVSILNTSFLTFWLLTFMICSELSSGDRHLISFKELGSVLTIMIFHLFFSHTISTMVFIYFFISCWLFPPWYGRCQSSANRLPTISCTISSHSRIPMGCLRKEKNIKKNYFSNVLTIGYLIIF